MSWKIVPAHTYIKFTVRHMMIRKVHGRFRKFGISFSYDEQNPVNTTVKVTIDTPSIDTRDKQRDNYLRSPGFLNVAEFPQMTFISKRVQQINSRNGRLTGDLTIQDTTREVILKVRQSTRTGSRKGITNTRFQASSTISRKAWGLEWNAALEAGGWLVGDKIDIDINLEIAKISES